jgi:hypothetical protein
MASPTAPPYPWPMATLTLDIKSELPKAIRWTDAMTKQLPYAIAKAMTQSAKKSQVALKAQTPRYVDRPTPFTLNSTFVRFASPRSLEAWVGFKYTAPKGTPAGEYLEPMISGGPRKPKRSELQLQRRGLLRSGEYLVPTGVTPLTLNKYGNIPASKYTQVISRLKGFGEQGYTANASGSARSQSKRRQADYFIGTPGGLPRGIYARLGAKPRSGGLARGFHTVFYITRRPTYTGRFPVQTILNKTYSNNFGKQFRMALEAELAYQARKGR